jgi:hypothetical protein
MRSISLTGEITAKTKNDPIIAKEATYRRAQASRKIVGSQPFEQVSLLISHLCRAMGWI